MMKIKKSLTSLIKVFSFLVMAYTTMGCSYVMDSIEASLTNRSSYSIEVSYDSMAQQVTVYFPDAQDGSNSEAFASYEIYVTDLMNDEFSGYEVIATGYDLLDSQVAVDTGLLNFNRDSWTFNISYSGTNGENISLSPSGANQTVVVPESGGKLYVRVGLVEWKEKKSSDRSSEWNPLTIGSMDYYFSTDKEYFFENYSELDGNVSTYEEVGIPAN